MTTPLTQKDSSQPQLSKARKDQAPRAQGSPASGERSEQDNRDYIARNLYKINPETDFDEKGNLIRTQRSEPRGQQQEWTTIELDFGFWGLFAGDIELCREFHYEADANKVRDAHNAELAAAWQEHDDVVDALANFSETIKQLGSRNQQLNEQLAAERKAKEREADRYCNAVKDHAETRMELIAERQGREQAEEQLKIRATEYVPTTKFLELRERLLSALAAIEKVKSAMVGDTEWPNLEVIDLSALHEHDAEVREPLVDALELMFQVHVLRCEQCSGHDNGCEQGQRLEQIKIDALAKVKDQ